MSLPHARHSTVESKDLNELSDVPWIDRVLSVQSPQTTAVEHEQSINALQARLPLLTYDNDGASAHLGKLPSIGCSACKQNRWVTVFIGKACNVPCSFCPQAPKPGHLEGRDDNGYIYTSFGRERFDELPDKLSQAAARGNIVAIGYSGGEPLMYVDRIEQYASKLNREHPKLYQYAYTNGVLACEETVQRLVNAGLRELRFDLAATSFSRAVIDRMRFAAKIIPMITVEVPALRGVAANIEQHASELAEIGVHQINMCEVVINEYNWEHFKNEPFYVHNPYDSELSLDDSKPYRRLVPVASRFETYKLIEAASRDNWPFVINDCSQAVHYKPTTPI